MELLYRREIFICIATSATMFSKVYTKSMKITNNIVSFDLHKEYLDMLLKSIEQKALANYDKSQLFGINISHNHKLAKLLHFNEISSADRAEIGDVVTDPNCKLSAETLSILPVPDTLKANVQIFDKRIASEPLRRLDYTVFKQILDTKNAEELAINLECANSILNDEQMVSEEAASINSTCMFLFN